MALLKHFMAAGLLASLFPVAWGTLPRNSIDRVEHAAIQAGAGRLVGIDFTGQGWDVYHVLDGRLMEWQMSDRTLTVVRREAQTGRAPEQHSGFRNALTAARRATRGTVISLELERDQEKGLVWSAIVRQGRYVWNVYLNGVTGRLIEVERGGIAPR